MFKFTDEVQSQLETLLGKNKLGALPPEEAAELTAITDGRATCDRLDMNDDRYQGERPIQEARALWKQAGIPPPPIRVSWIKTLVDLQLSHD